MTDSVQGGVPEGAEAIAADIEVTMKDGKVIGSVTLNRRVFRPEEMTIMFAVLASAAKRAEELIALYPKVYGLASVTPEADPEADPEAKQDDEG